MVCTEPYYTQVMRLETPGVEHGALWEGNDLLNDFHASGSDSNKYIPILLGKGDPSNIPDPLRGKGYYRLPRSYEDLYRLLTKQPYTPKPKLGTLKELPPKERKSFLSDTVPGRSRSILPTDLTVLRLCFEAAVRNGSGGVALQSGEIDQRAAAEGISAAGLQDSLQMLVQAGFIDVQYGTKHTFTPNSTFRILRTSNWSSPLTSLQIFGTLLLLVQRHDSQSGWWSGCLGSCNWRDTSNYMHQEGDH
jgi:hypothetical protein